MTEKTKTTLLDEVLAPTLAYQVTYRISQKETTTGTSAKRYDDLVDRLRQLDGVEAPTFEGRGHTSTSAWVVRYAGKARDLFERLRPAVTARLDMLEVIQVVTNNHARLPPPDQS